MREEILRERVSYLNEDYAAIVENVRHELAVPSIRVVEHGSDEPYASVSASSIRRRTVPDKTYRRRK